MIPFIFEKILPSKTNQPEAYINNEDDLENIIHNVQLEFARCKIGDTVDESEQNNEVTDKFVIPTFNYVFEVSFVIDVFSELDPSL